MCWNFHWKFIIAYFIQLTWRNHSRKLLKSVIEIYSKVIKNLASVIKVICIWPSTQTGWYVRKSEGNFECYHWVLKLLYCIKFDKFDLFEELMSQYSLFHHLCFTEIENCNAFFIITSADEVEEVMFSVPCVCVFVCLCVCLFVCLWTAYSPQFCCDFVQNFRQVSSLPRIETIKFWTLTSLTLTLTLKVKTTILLQSRSKFQKSFILT